MKISEDSVGRMVVYRKVSNHRNGLETDSASILPFCSYRGTFGNAVRKLFSDSSDSYLIEWNGDRYVVPPSVSGDRPDSSLWERW